MKSKFHLSSFIWLALTILALLPAAAGFETARRWGDRLAKDGSLELLTPARYGSLRLITLALAGIFLLLGIWTILNHSSYENFWHRTGEFFKNFFPRLAQDNRRLFGDLGTSLHLSAAEWLAFAVILLAGIAVRWIQISCPIRHDEAYSIVTWGRSSLRYTITDYQLPNNHILHNVLVNILWHHFGKSLPWVRLPAFLAGVLLIPAVFLAAQTLYNRRAAFLAAGFTAFAPYLIDYSVNARGYTMMSLDMVLLMGLTAYMLRKKNLAAWIFWILIAALSFYVMPVALFPFGGVCMWIFLAVLFRKQSSEYQTPAGLLKYLIVSGLLVIALVILLYTPVFLNSGTSAVFGNDVVQATPLPDFIQTEKARFSDIFHAFTDTVPAFVWILAVLGNLLALVLNARMSSARVPFQFGYLLWMILYVGITRPVLWPRTQLYLLPFLIVWGAGGLVFAAERLMQRLSPRAVQISCALLSAALLIPAAIPQFAHAVKNAHPDDPRLDAVRTVMQDDMEKVLFVVAPGDDADLWYYAYSLGAPDSLFDKKLPFRRLYVYVDPVNESYNAPTTLEDTLSRFGPGGNFILMDTQQTLMERSDAVLYKYQANEHAVEKAYGYLP